MVAGSSDVKQVMQIVDGYFKDYRWVNGRWDLSQFSGADGTTDWDKVRLPQHQSTADLDFCAQPEHAAGGSWAAARRQRALAPRRSAACTL